MDYQAAPNTAVPLNNRQRGEVASVAVEQLRSYQGRATYWPVERHVHYLRACWCCTVCDPCETLWFVADTEDNVFTYTEDEILTLKVAHIRQTHDSDGSNDGKRTD